MVAQAAVRALLRETDPVERHLRIAGKARVGSAGAPLAVERAGDPAIGALCERHRRSRAPRDLEVAFFAQQYAPLRRASYWKSALSPSVILPWTRRTGWPAP